MCFCENCNKEVDFEVKGSLESYVVLGIPIQCWQLIPYCKVCHEEVYISEIERINDLIVYTAYDEYCERHDLPNKRVHKKIKLHK